MAFTAMNSAGLPPLVLVRAGLHRSGCGDREGWLISRFDGILAVLITAIGVSYFLQNLALLIFGADTKTSRV